MVTALVALLLSQTILPEEAFASDGVQRQVYLKSREMSFAETEKFTLNETENTVKDVEVRPEPVLHAQAAALIDGETGRLLYGKNAQELLPNASTTKILTCIVALEQGNLDQICTASEYACSMPETKCGFLPGESFYLRDLLYSLMLESQNDSAIVIAETVSGSVEQFAAKMNQKAAELGCTTYHFITPNGLDGEDGQGIHGISAFDLAKIMNYCRKNATFLKITQTASYSFTNTEGTRQYQVQNKNAFLTMQTGILSGKTGYTSKAGYCYVCAYEENGRDYSIALLTCGWPSHKNYKWEDARALISYGNQYFSIQNISQQVTDLKAEISGGVRLTEHGWEFPDTVRLRTDFETLERLKADDETVTTRLDLDESILPPTDLEKEIGRLELYIGDEQIGVQKLYAADEIESFTFSFCRKLVLKEFLQKVFT